MEALINTIAVICMLIAIAALMAVLIGRRK